MTDTAIMNLLHSADKLKEDSMTVFVEPVCACCGQTECTCDCDLSKRGSFLRFKPEGTDFEFVIGFVGEVSPPQFALPF